MSTGFNYPERIRANARILWPHIVSTFVIANPDSHPGEAFEILINQGNPNPTPTAPEGLFQALLVCTHDSKKKIVARGAPGGSVAACMHALLVTVAGALRKYGRLAGGKEETMQDGGTVNVEFMPAAAVGAVGEREMPAVRSAFQ